ncbi:16S rRNA (guanine(527)-N(7))-methyltransferase RsmG [Nesterenkonia aurantiaca]|uniref:Ribosomal RNA small subunit methyltransferase G n=1 Tax=Nesterenkonia aurantiaca TaxID=1436010 RepID=A0A4R7G6C0_9MICC|nr:16S rRNA (guanine(527)-N(7))-methyltransferase RsmG [Nesterenkonia aurantiaca]TDS86750.1 16S rRNA (guanine527-N7)-methyltransferase [Nesterenkonia aurantiaca]
MSEPQDDREAATHEAVNNAQLGEPELPGQGPSLEAPELSEQEQRAAEVLFGDRLDLAKQYVAHLCSTGIEHGLLGPREVPIMWSRHVLNCAVLGPELSAGTTVADVGSGAGLPGLALAIARPDVEFILIEPMERRVEWLSTVVQDLQLDNVQLIRARAEEVTDEVMADVVTARAVTGLKKLLPLTVPLLDDDGELMLIKGRSARGEIAAAGKSFSKHKLTSPTVELLGEDLLEEPSTVVRCRRRSAGPR